MEILKKQAVRPVQVRCGTCRSDLMVVPEDVRRMGQVHVRDDNGYYTWCRVMCPVCGCEEDFNVEDLYFAKMAYRHLYGKEPVL